MMGIFHDFCRLLIFFKATFSKKIFQECHEDVKNSLDPGQARRFIGRDLGPNCLQMLSPDEKSHRLRGTS